MSRCENEKAKVPAPRPDEKFPRCWLPVGGLYPFMPPGLGMQDKGEGGRGFLDKNGNVWQKDTGGHCHWDVQHPSGKHTNVDPWGNVDHNADNFQ